MNKKCIKKIILGIVILILSVIYFGITSKSNAANILETWDLSEDDGTSNVTGTLYEDGKFIVSGNGKMIGDAFIDSIEKIKVVEIEKGITSIGEYSFSEAINLAQINIEEDVKVIEEWVFADCPNLKEINVSNNNKSFSSEDGILFNKEKTKIVRYPPNKEEVTYSIPNGIQTIGEVSFEGCNNIKCIDFPSSVTYIEESSFCWCSQLKEIQIPENVENIGAYSFDECDNLTNIVVSKNNKNYSSLEGVLFNKDKTELIKYPDNKEGTKYIIPSDVFIIKSRGFKNCKNLYNIEIPNTKTKIEDSVFSDCVNLTRIKIPSELKIIEYRTFENCYSLIDIEFPQSIIEIGYRAFYNCTSLANIELPDNTTIKVDGYAFGNCTNLSKLDFNDKVKATGDYIFSDAILTIPVNVDERSILDVDLPEIISDLIYLYKDKNVAFQNCYMNDETKKIEIEKDNFDGMDIFIKFYQTDILSGLKIKFVPSGTITYNIGIYTKMNVVATLHIVEEEKIINNDGNNTYIFNKNGEFSFNYLDINNRERQAIAKVNNIEEVSIEQYEKTIFDNNNYIEKILPNTTVSSFTKSIETNGIIKILKNGQEITSENDLICTGMTMKVSWGNNEEIIYTTIVTGDLTGNGKMGIGDLSKLSRYAAGMDETLSGAYLRASDVVKDGKYGRISDISKMSRVLAGMDNL